MRLLPPGWTVPDYRTTELAFPAHARAIAVAVADIDADGVLDIVAVGSGDEDAQPREGYIRLYLRGKPDPVGPASYTVHDIVTPPGLSSVALADIDSDGDNDIAVANHEADTVTVIASDGDGVFGPRTDYPLRNGPISVELADIDGDSHPDLIAASEGGLLAISFNDGRGGFSKFATTAQPHGITGLTLGDFNGDRRPDVALTVPNSTGISLILNSGGRSLEPAQEAGAFGIHAGQPGHGDFNKDGRADLAAPIFETGMVHVLLGSGAAAFRLFAKLGVGPSPRFVIADDFNSDGNDDIAVLTNNPDNLVLLYGTPRSTFASARPIRVGAIPRAAAAADLNADGITDFVTANAGARHLTAVTSIAGDSRLAHEIPGGPYGPSPSAAGTVPRYFRAVAMFKNADYFASIRELTRIERSLAPRYAAGRLNSDSPTGEARIFVAATLLHAEILRYFTKQPQSAFDKEFALGEQARSLGDWALACGQFMSAAEIARADLDDTEQYIRAIIATYPCAQRGNSATSPGSLLALMAASALDRAHSEYQDYQPLLNQLTLETRIEWSALEAAVLPHLDAYRELAAGPGVYAAFAARHPRSFRAEVASLAGLRDRLAASRSSVEATAAGFAFRNQHPDSILGRIGTRLALRAAEAAGESGRTSHQ